MSVQINYPFGAGSETDPNSLHLDGGTMSVNASIGFTSTAGNVSSVSASSFHIEDSNANYIDVSIDGGIVMFDPNGSANRTTIGTGFINFHDDNSGHNASYSGSVFSVASGALQGGDYGITFPDNTIQTTAAVTPDLTPYLEKSDNLNSVSDKATARTNLGLAYATNAQSNAGTSASTVLTPSNSLWTSMSPAFHNAFANNTTTTNSSGNGGSQVSDAWGLRNFTGTTASSYSSIKNGATTSYATSRGQQNGNLDWSKIIIFSGTCLANQFVANSTCRAGFGVANNHLNTDLSSKGIGYRIVGTGAVELQVHNGTTLSNVTSTFTPTSNTAFDFVIYSDGAGNATLYINDNSVATSSNAPIGGGSNTYNCFFCETDISANVSTQTIHGIGNPKIYIGR